jgi:exodeoxyribonuclease X
MPFGKHKGLRFSELPWDYLDWVTSKSEMGEDIKFSARCELQRRRSS